MRQVVIVRRGSPDQGLRMRELPTPSPGPDQVLIAAEALGVNFADTLARRGLYPGAPHIPYVPGFEVAGRIEALGANVRSFQVGDPVLALLLQGGYADHVLVPAGATYRRPPGLGAEIAAALPVQALTAWYALHESGTVRPGDRVLIHAAAGGVGSLAVQLALHAGATVFGTAGSEEKLARLREAGVHYPLNYRTHDYAAEIRRLTGGEGVDIVLDSLGGSHIGKAFGLLRAGGRVSSYGYSAQSGGILRMYLGFLTMKTLRTAYLLRDSHGFYGVNLVKLAGCPDRLALRIADVLRSWQEGILHPSIGARFPLAEAARAHEALENRRTTGKVLLIP
jgi:NADPH:quinone reductase-like Zn-dependent oxidoreductase